MSKKCFWPKLKRNFYSQEPGGLPLVVLSQRWIIKLPNLKTVEGFFDGMLMREEEEEETIRDRPDIYVKSLEKFFPRYKHETKEEDGRKSSFRKLNIVYRVSHKQWMTCRNKMSWALCRVMVDLVVSMLNWRPHTHHYQFKIALWFSLFSYLLIYQPREDARDFRVRLFPSVLRQRLLLHPAFVSKQTALPLSPRKHLYAGGEEKIGNWW